MKIGDNNIGRGTHLFFIAGPCVIESEPLVMSIAEELRAIGERLGVFIIFKASFDKANRSSGSSFREPGMDEDLRMLAKVRDETGMLVLTDVHTPEQARTAA
jgi:2-dehydro-3-deoxyphosphooctonate aldolase (KDO 8-P synthase)